MHIGKTIRLVVDAADAARARAQVEEMCERLLANPVIEAYEVTIAELDARERPRIGVVLFPGTNCELDVHVGGRAARRRPAEILWHGDADDAAASTRSSCPAGSRTATTCAPARSPGSRR